MSNDMSDIWPMEPDLTLRERFRLIEIAHETKDPEIRQAALRLVQTRQLVMMAHAKQDPAAS